MKELTIEEKAKRYDEALTKARNIVNSINVGLIGKDSFEAVFPELKESEDERISREITEFLVDFNNGEYERPNENTIDSWLSWLEKQGEEIIPLEQIILNVWELGNYWKELTKGFCNTEYGTQLDYIAKHWKEGEHYIKSLKKQGEQKPADLPNGEDYGIDGLYHAISILEKTLGKVDGYQSDDGILEHKCAINAVKELYEQKPVNIVTILNDYFANTPKEQQDKDWEELKHLNNFGEFVVQKPAWSEEDENRINRLIAYFEDKESFTAEDDVVYANWLKSIRPQSHWKPSEEMLEALYRAIPENVMEISEDEMLLNKLYQGLKYGRVLSKK